MPEKSIDRRTLRTRKALTEAISSALEFTRKPKEQPAIVQTASA